MNALNEGHGFRKKENSDVSQQVTLMFFEKYLQMLEEKLAQCPYCWESIYFEIDLSEPNQEYVEDCQVCCRPIRIHVSVDYNGETQAQGFSENE